ncbi:FAD-binding oxidoreductase [Ferrimicrobium acidiphilum]|jgi:glycolate oxidase|uniref:Putative FAD-linked oxidoreductase n=1 Tax=Ferrimicrobium acidiphilum DSM 19497 TaxID=1121877 RepID=A0A0D8FV77_9ACTN|nr:FAD-linked oxidase C-terminal domain-containing protein [Ferrimicrobium acidiphilum]KJE76839.1 putative FAD-linked oxidoreductase [Ferrimicrobium acidiphilum DSM 19497]
MTSSTRPSLKRDLSSIVGGDHTLVGTIPEAYTHDEALELDPVEPMAVVFPTSRDHVGELIKYANANLLPLVPRGSGTGLSGGARPVDNGVVCSFEKMNRILAIDTIDQTAMVEPGVTLDQLEQALTDTPYFYPVYPGEMSASLGGNVATNAGGMRAMKYGVTRHNVLGLEFITGSGVRSRSGGAYVKTSSGYDLTQLIVGSEGTLALVTRVLLRLSPRAHYRTLVLASFGKFEDIAVAVDSISRRGLLPSILEYMEASGLRAMAEHAGINLGVTAEVSSSTAAYLMVELEAMNYDDLEWQTNLLVEVLTGHNSTEQYVLDETQRRGLISARESAFWTVKKLGANVILDTVVPRSKLTELFKGAAACARERNAVLVGTGHVGDGNVHLSLFQSDPIECHATANAIIELAQELGGTISGEHGIGLAKRSYLLEHEDPARLSLMNSIKSIFDPLNVLNPGKLL